jgi:hypothetical protein
MWPLHKMLESSSFSGILVLFIIVAFIFVIRSIVIYIQPAYGPKKLVSDKQVRKKLSNLNSILKMR